VDPTSCSVSGASETDPEAAEAAWRAIASGSSRDHRADLKQWMLALVTTHDGDVPLFLRPLDGTRSDNVSISATVTQGREPLRESQPGGAEEPFAIVDRGGSSQANRNVSNKARIRWWSRVPETSPEAKAALA
jgi:transposase